MELSIPVYDINAQNIYFVDKKRNIIVEGDFIKIVYSTDAYEMIGLYATIDFNVTSTTTTMFDHRILKKTDQSWTQIASRNPTLNTRRMITFDPFSKENNGLIENLCTIEREIIERYISEYCPSKLATYSLRIQLMSGVIKYHSENKEVERGPELVNDSDNSARGCVLTERISTRRETGDENKAKIKERCILKISGVWETATNVGITMKFILLR